MLDLNGLLDGDLHTRVYSSPAGTIAKYVTWQKPKGCRMVFMLTVAGGGGGGGGRTNALATSRGGGGAGGSGAVTRNCLNANMIPDVLYVLVGSGGKGGAAGSAGTAGGETSILASQLAVTNNIYCTSSGGGAGTGSISGTGGGAGAGGAASTTANTAFMASGNFISFAGQAGIAGSSAAATGLVGGNRIAMSNGIITSGCGGAACGTDNVNFNGGGIVASGNIEQDIVGASGGTGNKGGDGYMLRKPLCAVGGAGGGTNALAGVGGAGGDGSVGCGGGGGGGGITGGAGGNGGGGLVIIISW